MNIFLRQKSTPEGAKPTLAVMPFVDISNINPDPLLAQSLPFAFYDLLSATSESLFHPYVVQFALSELALPAEALNQMSSAAALSQKINASHVIYGSVQRTLNDELRFFISIYDAKTGGPLTQALQFSTDLTDVFFSELTTEIKTLLKPLGLTKNSLDNPDKIPKLISFRYYVKGMEYAERYNVTHLKLSLVWFEKALKESYYNYPDAAREMARAHLMLGLLDKIEGQDAASHLMAAQKLMDGFSGYNLKKIKPKEAFTTRFLGHSTAFINAISLWKANDTTALKKLAQTSLKNVPEDGQMRWLGEMAGLSISPHAATTPVCWP